MAPLELMNAPRDTDNDEAFLTLLSSQRALLSRLNMESAAKKQQAARRTQQQPSRSLGPGPFYGNADPFSLMNTPIIERGGMDMLVPRRLSVGYGNHFGGFNLTDTTRGSALKQKYTEVDPKKMKRRRSSLGILSSFLPDDSEQPGHQSRRLSMLSTFSGGLNDVFSLDNENSDSNANEKQTEVRMDPRIRPETVKKNLLAFSKAMESSTQSQQDIHDWDRKMGLKRSHSKTMRLTMRSRKKLRTMLKKDINSASSPGNEKR